jgi:hypothetical protein
MFCRIHSTTRRPHYSWSMPRRPARIRKEATRFDPGSQFRPRRRRAWSSTADKTGGRPQRSEEVGRLRSQRDKQAGGHAPQRCNKSTVCGRAGALMREGCSSAAGWGLRKARWIGSRLHQGQSNGGRVRPMRHSVPVTRLHKTRAGRALQANPAVPLPAPRPLCSRLGDN